MLDDEGVAVIGSCVTGMSGLKFGSDIPRRPSKAFSRLLEEATRTALITAESTSGKAARSVATLGFSGIFGAVAVVGVEAVLVAVGVDCLVGSGTAESDILLFV